MKFSDTKNLESDFFYKDSKSNKKNSICWERREGEGTARISGIFLYKESGK